MSSAAAAAEVVSERPDAVAVTLYSGSHISTADLVRNGPYLSLSEAFGLIVETRTLELPAGSSTIRFRNVASTMQPSSAIVKGLPQGALEQDFDYDLLSPGSLLARSVGQVVRRVTADPATGKERSDEALVRSAAQGAVLEIGGKFEALHCGGPPERLVFDRIPDGLTPTPTFSVRAFVPAAGRYTVTLSYIAAKLNWSANYVARVDPGGQTLDLSGWITLANFSDTSFADAPTDVVAGHLNIESRDDFHSAPETIVPQCWPMDIDWGTRVLSESIRCRLEGRCHYPQTGVYSSSPVTAVSIDGRPLGDYKLYTLPQRTTIAARQTKQVQFLDQHGVKFERIYAYEVSLDPDAPPKMNPWAVAEYRIENRQDRGLGKPLPGGAIAVMEPGTDGAPVFVGEIEVDDTAVGAPVYVDAGGALDLWLEQRLVETRKFGSGTSQRRRDTYEVEIANDKTVPVRFELYQDLSRARARMVSHDRAYAMYRGAARWTLELAPGQRDTVRYSVEYAPDDL